ncbi:MAG: L-threonylcarbamoyladenylate synthase [Pseudomonadota bacterium]
MVEVIHELNEQNLKRIVRVIDDGGVISFPTETVYALAADASNPKAVERIYQIKRRYNDKALPILVGEIYQAKRIAEFDERAKKLAFRLFPGPLTLVLKAKPHSNLASNVNKDKETIGIRMPKNLPAIKILQAVGRPLVGTSANITNQESATDADEVINSLGDQIDIIIDKGRTEHAAPSTIIDLSEAKAKILRQGIISKQLIEEILGEPTI